MVQQLTEELVREIEAIGREYLISKIVLFGSRARGDAKPTSDIDLAIYTLPDFADRGRFESCIEDLATLLKIDLVFVNDDTESKLMENIRKDGVIIYERSSN